MNKRNQNHSYGAGDADDAESPRKDSLTGNLTGRVKRDDRDNAIWEWATKTGEVRARSAKPGLAADAPTPIDPVKPNPLGTVKGYSPYNSGLLVKKQSTHKKKDLRKLSEWVKLKKLADRKNRED